MPFAHDVGDSTPEGNPDKDGTWQSLGALAAKLVEKAKGGAK